MKYSYLLGSVCVVREWTSTFSDNGWCNAMLKGDVCIPIHLGAFGLNENFVITFLTRDGIRKTYLNSNKVYRTL